jgi:hypothetical protein
MPTRPPTLQRQQLDPASVPAISVPLACIVGSLVEVSSSFPAAYRKYCPCLFTVKLVRVLLQLQHRHHWRGTLVARAALQIIPLLLNAGRPITILPYRSCHRIGFAERRGRRVGRTQWKWITRIMAVIIMTWTRKACIFPRTTMKNTATSMRTPSVRLPVSVTPSLLRLAASWSASVVWGIFLPPKETPRHPHRRCPHRRRLERAVR